jgi:uncharacterized NAD-dependent epimerase/dehydratase family protein
MSERSVVTLRPPYLLFLGDLQDPLFAKTAFGLRDWRPKLVAGQHRLPGCGVDLGVPELSIADAAAQGVGSLVIGVASIGGRLAEAWHATILEAIRAGLDIVSGMHSRLADIDGFTSAAANSGAKLVDVRVPPANIPVGTGARRPGKRVLMVGTDCAVGKKYSALALAQALTEGGIEATFRATGQTGIMIAGEGIAIDAVVADFISGAAELISPANSQGHWDVIEGQGSLFNPGYAGVTLGLMHGSQADALVMCHEATQTEILGWTGYQVPSLDECMDTYLAMAKLTNPTVRFAGLSINTSKLPARERRPYLDGLSDRFGLPCVDPIVDGSTAIARHIRDSFAGART